MPIAATAAMSVSATKAFEAIAKTKKQTWKAMERAMEQVKSSASSLGLMSSLMGVFGIVTKLATAPLKELIADLVSEEGFIETLKALGTAGGDVLTDTFKPLLKVFTQMGGEEGGIIPLIGSLVKLSNIMSKISLLPVNAFMGLFSGAVSNLGIEVGTLPEGIDKVVGAFDDLGDKTFNFFKDLVEKVEVDISKLWKSQDELNEEARAAARVGVGEPSLTAEQRAEIAREETNIIITAAEAAQMAAEEAARAARAARIVIEGGGGMVGGGRLLEFQFGGIVPRTGPYILHAREEVIEANKRGRGRGEIHVHIDLRNAVVDNVDRLTQKIAEQVLIQIG